MDDIDRRSIVKAIHGGVRISVLRTIGEQSKELKWIEQSVTCPCGRQRNVRSMFQCLYCEVWFCKKCAKDHFGEPSSTETTQNGDSA